METIPGARVRGSLVRRLFFEGKALGTRLGYIMLIGLSLILGDPGADSGGEGKSKRAEK